jgi:hypothetical protein
LIGLLLEATDEAKEGTFIWESSRTKMIFYDWLAGEPSDPGHSQNCIQLHLVYWQWFDMFCDDIDHATMCEMIFPCH